MNQDDARFARHLLLPGWQQERLADARVVMIGMGALGNSVAQNLALAGVGRLLLCDPDRVERSNLSRCPLFCETDLGRHKVEAAGTALQRLAPGITIETRPFLLEKGVGLGELRAAHLVISGLDSRTARMELSGRCGLVRAPWLDGATGPWEGEVRPYLNPDGPCYGCNKGDLQRAESDVPISCDVVAGEGDAGASAPISALIGSHMALMATRFLMGLPIPSDILVLDGVKGTMTPVSHERDKQCPFHRPIPLEIPRISVDCQATVGDLMAALPAGGEPLSWNPVRTRATCRTCAYSHPSPALTTGDACPHCGGTFSFRTTLELSALPRELVLSNIGIAPREILALRGGNGIGFIELS